MRLNLPPRGTRLAILARVHAELDRGSMTDDERRDFDLARAYEMHRAELRRNPQAIAPELPLAIGQESDPSTGATSTGLLARAA